MKRERSLQSVCVVLSLVCLLQLFLAPAAWGGKIRVSTGPGGSITPGSGIYFADQLFAITPSAGYYISQVTLNGVDTPASAVSGKILVPKSPTEQTLYATFHPSAVYTISVHAGSHGAVIPAASSVSVYQGNFKTFTIKPEDGYGIRYLTVDGGAASCDADGKYTFSDVRSDHTLDVGFDRVYTVSATSGDHGTISPSGAVPVLSGDSRLFSFTPASGYVVDTVLVDGVSYPAGATYQLTGVQDNHTIRVTFKSYGESARSYCSAPPFVPSGIKANLLLLIDNSSSMYDLAYTGSSYCLESGYQDGNPYPGYFEEGTFYAYDGAGNRFAPVPSLPGGCNAVSTSYVCVDMAGIHDATSTRSVSRFAASGKFLNWLTTSRLDLEKKVLTGGKFLDDGDGSGHGVLQGESRGCQGKRFVKMIDDTSPITFAVRGPLTADPDYVYQAGFGGATRIEIYDNRYRRAECQQVVADWKTFALDLGTIQNHARACLGDSTVDRTGTPTKSAVYYEVMPDCYHFLGNNPLPLDQQLYDDCLKRLQTYGGAADRSTLYKNPEDDSICAAGIKHIPHNYSSGYLGMCYDTTNTSWYNSSNVGACASPYIKDFCLEIGSPSVTDPSATDTAANDANLASFFLEAGLSALGAVAGTFQARVALDSAPAGEVQAFANDIDFGVMIFNDNGAGTECKGAPGAGEIYCLKRCSLAPRFECYENADCTPDKGTCSAVPPTDGGRVISYIGHSPLGDHTPGSGLIAAIDAINANAWTPFAEAFYNAIGYFANRGDLRLQQGDFDLQFPPSRYSCQRNNILIIGDGMSTADANGAVNALAALYRQSGGSTGWDSVNHCPAFSGSRSLDDLAWLAQNRNIKTFNTTVPSVDTPGSASASITTHVIYTGSATVVPGDECNPATLLDRTAANGGGRYLNARNPAQLDAMFKDMLQLISGSSSGSDAALVPAGWGNGSIFLQPLFYPKKSFDAGTGASWVGELQALWFYTDPFLGTSDGSTSGAREESGYSGSGDHFLDLDADLAVTFPFDTTLKRTRANLFRDGNGDGTADAVQPPGYPLDEEPDQVQSLWRAGVSLWRRDPSTRTLYTQTDDLHLVDFAALDPTLAGNRTLLQAQGASAARSTIDFVTGRDNPPATRNRTVIRSATDNIGRVWKLGDVISSTPRVQSPLPLNSYHLSPPSGYGDPSYRAFTTPKPRGSVLRSGTYDYGNRGTVYLGANDGMLHALRLGRVRGSAGATESPWPLTRKAALSGSLLGQEEWSFIPKNVLPYLTYLKDPGYGHLYYVDGGITLADVSIGRSSGCGAGSPYWDCPKDLQQGSNWRTVLLGGMGLGGASRGANDACVAGAAGTCVKAPLATVGRSSYFALDVTGQAADGSGDPPTLLWEFAAPGLGFATSGGAILRISARTGPKHDFRDKNGRWFAVFGSGPTGPIDGDNCRFKGTSDQRLKFFVVDLGAQMLVPGVSWWEIDARIDNAFAGSIAGGGIDTDRWSPMAQGFYEDDALYLGYTRLAADGTWTEGGVVRLATGEDPDPARWKVSTLIDGVGPVTGAIAKIQDRNRHKLWLFFGTGRYAYNQDDMTGSRALYGISDPCYTGADVLDANCTTPRAVGDLTDKSSNPSGTPEDKGWYITLDGADTPSAGFGSERVLGTPTATTSGAIYFPTFKPAADPCALGGTSYLWGVRHDSGGSLPGQRGKALLPLSTGSLAEIGLSGGLPDKGGRRTLPMTGKPGAPKIVTNVGLAPLKRILHIQER